ncbi:MAG: response regulator [Phycisphaerae bacterium]
MVARAVQSEPINILASGLDWAWPQALRQLFQPRGVTLLLAKNADESVSVLRSRRIHTAVLDMDTPGASAAVIKLIRSDYPRLPCIALKSSPCTDVLTEALELDIFAVVDKPVDLDILQQLLNRLFVKIYNSDIFNLVP